MVRLKTFNFTVDLPIIIFYINQLIFFKILSFITLLYYFLVIFWSQRAC